MYLCVRGQMSCICVLEVRGHVFVCLEVRGHVFVCLEVSMLTLPTISLLILELFWQCIAFCFSFYFCCWYYVVETKPKSDPPNREMSYIIFFLLLYFRINFNY